MQWVGIAASNNTSFGKVFKMFSSLKKDNEESVPLLCSLFECSVQKKLVKITKKCSEKLYCFLSNDWLLLGFLC